MIDRPASPLLEAGQASPARGDWLLPALALGLAAAVGLGLARFAYGLLLPAMRLDLQWSWFTAGAMNTVNAAGYLVGALLAPAAFARWEARRVMLWGGVVAALAMAAHGAVRDAGALYVLRGLTGVASAALFVAGGLLAARLATQAPAGRSGLVLGLYYGSTGLGIVAGAVGVPLVLPDALPQRWPLAWGLLAALAAVLVALTAFGTRGLADSPRAGPGARLKVPRRAYVAALLGYLCFGLGYIGYMTFAIGLLSERGFGPAARTGFFVVLGLGVVASSWLWAGLLQRHRSGRPLAVLNGLLALATVLPVLSLHPVAVYASGALFGAVFLSVVASTTAFVRHNLPAAAWPSGIAAFTVVFAAGQIVGPSGVGWIADGPGGLLAGFAASAATLLAGALIASRQRPLDPASPAPR